MILLFLLVIIYHVLSWIRMEHNLCIFVLILVPDCATAVHWSPDQCNSAFWCSADYKNGDKCTALTAPSHEAFAPTPPPTPQSVLASVLAFTPNHLLVKRLCMIRDTLCIVPNRGIGNILTEERFSELAASYCFARKTLAHCLVLHKTTLCPKYSSEFVQSCCSVWNRDINRTPVGVNCGQTAALRVSVPP